MSLILIVLALALGLVGAIGSAVTLTRPANWFAALGFLGVALLAVALLVGEL